MCDSSFADADEQRSTGCDMCFLQGGIISMGSFVPDPIAMSATEAESNAQAVACMKLSHIKQIVMDVRFGNPNRNYTIPLLTDTSAAIAMSKNDQDTKRTRHIDRRWLYARQACRSGQISLYHVDGNKFQLADLGTKNVSAGVARDKLNVFEVDSEPHAKASDHTQIEEG
jgi:hypothetical protein